MRITLTILSCLPAGTWTNSALTTRPYSPEHAAAVANTLALKEAGIFENPPEMDDGLIVTDEKQGFLRECSMKERDF